MNGIWIVAGATGKRKGEVPKPDSGPGTGTVLALAGALVLCGKVGIAFQAFGHPNRNSESK